MNIFQKLNIILDTKNYSYNPAVDKILLKLIEKGKYVKHDEHYMTIEHNNSLYCVWLANFPYADLTSCTKENINSFCDISVYKEMRPSRKVQIMFWEWAEQYVGSNFHKIRVSTNLNYDEYQKKLKDQDFCLTSSSV